ncbi:cytochrome P450 [Longispora fulva]|uniref:Cytochrome P450 n=1 Tax=Longispora fulva TaxID=619741 RepID=A0A8J7GHG4_9ACTN|nr:cytochrome P450 [Longispora fulva]MBG6137590.1 cytochrome P450 [Longispora fulva]GIG61055.1 cytochrome P450 [Longispora fulva]
MPIPFPLPDPPTLYHPTPLLAELRENEPVAQVRFPDGKLAWLVTRYADVRTVMTDNRFSRAAASTPDQPQMGLGSLATESLIAKDPPEHTRLRRLVARAFTHRRVEELRPRVADVVTELLAGLRKQPEPADLVQNFSLPLPVQVICDLLGVPATDRDRFHGWSDAVMGNWERDQEIMVGGLTSLSQYFAELIAEKRAHPGDDLMTGLIAARDEHDKLTEQELVTLGIGLLIGGHETTANQINMFLLTLREHPAELARLREDPSLLESGVEELMRFTQLGNSVSSMIRVTTEDVELGGVTIPAGSPVMPALGAANRDPAVFVDPDRLDVTRADNPHIGFGAGAHHCLGAQLARMELQEALRGLLHGLPNLRIVAPESELVFKPTMIVRSLESLPVAWS